MPYSGERRNGRRHGQGSIAYSDGCSYSGGWEAGKWHGHGTFTNPNHCTYTGGWENGKRHGQGTMTWHSGATYTGSWRNGERHSSGTYTHPDGSIYLGDWEREQFLVWGAGADQDSLCDYCARNNYKAYFFGGARAWRVPCARRNSGCAGCNTNSHAVSSGYMSAALPARHRCQHGHWWLED
ncbi:radial spoke head 1 homolog [Anaerolineaceae bacterium]|nr:radial spoke head 1 homolog [Anaerolineaceae bacterium]